MSAMDVSTWGLIVEDIKCVIAKWSWEFKFEFFFWQVIQHWFFQNLGGLKIEQNLRSITSSYINFIHNITLMVLRIITDFLTISNQNLI